MTKEQLDVVEPLLAGSVPSKLWGHKSDRGRSVNKLLRNCSEASSTEGLFCFLCRYQRKDENIDRIRMDLTTENKETVDQRP